MVGAARARTAARLVRRAVRRSRRRIVALARFQEWDEGALLMVFGLGIGAVVGLGVVAFYKLIDLAYLAFAVLPARRLDVLGQVAYRPLLTALGLWTAWAIVRRLRLPDGQNVPDVQRAVAKRGGDIKLRPVAGRTLAAAVTLGSGGSAGSEGPVAVLGSALGSTLGRLFRVETRHRKILVGCGAAAGISGAFGAPFAGAFFALEEVLGTFSTGAFSPVVVASVVGALTTRAFLGDAPVVIVPDYGAVPPLVVLLLYPLLGVACGAMSAFYTRSFFRMQDATARLRGPEWVRPVLAGLAVGALAFTGALLVTGHGHLRIPMGELAALSWYLLLGLAVAKVLMTAATFAGGGSGGVFTPTLFIGAAFGAGLGALVGEVLPNAGTSPVRWGLVGMAGLVAGATRAPITAIFMVFEITDDYGLVLPLMLVSVLAYATARRLAPHGLYDGWLARRGEHLAHGADRALMERIHVKEAMDAAAISVPPETTLAGLIEATAAARLLVLPVVDADGTLLGVIRQPELRAALLDRGDLAAVLVAEDLAEPGETAAPDASLRDALRAMNARTLDALPVVDPRTGRYLGMLSRADLLAAYERGLLQEV